MNIPLTVPSHLYETFKKNMNVMMGIHNKLLLFAYDHRLEHLQKDFYGNEISSQAPFVEHPFLIATNSKITGFVTHLGLLSRYGSKYQNIPYIVKLTGKITIAEIEERSLYSYPLCSVLDVIQFQQQSGLCIPSVAAAIYLGSEFEKEMIQYASHMVLEAHKVGLVAILFIYFRNKMIIKPASSMLLAGAAGIANVLGADIVKLHAPQDDHGYQYIVTAAGNTKIIYAGGDRLEDDLLYTQIKKQIQNGSHGVAIGRNIFQRPQKEAITLINKIDEIFCVENN